MAFRDYVYELDDGSNSMLIRLDSDQSTEAGAVTGDPTIKAHVRVSKGKKEFGVSPRYIVLGREVGTAPDTFTKKTRLPICTVAKFDEYALNAAVTVNEVSYTVRDKVDEDLV